ncbi:hypothetical protein EKG40_14715 [Pseudomonas moorei]|nr:hypothetical protein C1890_14110 [Pseudomonas sp. DP16D-R1]RZO07594.1 hypothetical protein EKG40_14715 [Pseudomonas moorei]
MPIFFRVSVADLVKSRSSTGTIPLAQAANETNRLPMAQMDDIFKVGAPWVSGGFLLWVRSLAATCLR